MRLVQLSDIHLSEGNKEQLANYYISSLITDLQLFNEQQRIDVILFTGDLVDKGGDSLGASPYHVFQELVIDPIVSALNIPKSKVLFVPGNHDTNIEKIHKENEVYLTVELTSDLANETLKEAKDSFIPAIKRIENFKLFEHTFHAGNISYVYSNMESLVTLADGEKLIGIALINDSWRCSPRLKQDAHFIGYNQLFNAKRFFKKKQTDLNIAVFHHPLEFLNIDEREEIENILKSQNFQFAIFGHKHEHHFESLISPTGGFITLNGRSAFNDTGEKKEKYQPGYNILDINLVTRQYQLQARKFIRSGYRFDKDVQSLPDGSCSGPIDPLYVRLSPGFKIQNTSLPSGYSADVNRIVSLLIGKSLYPNPFIFVRELIQNSVDACNRVKEERTFEEPKIIVNINSNENYFEVLDQGDGMTKTTLSNHFAVIGRSISQDYQYPPTNLSLISQFGIGFISTFIVSQKVLVYTKSEKDGPIEFEIANVFQGFSYKQASDIDTSQINISGSLVRVYLKKQFGVNQILKVPKTYCRHVANLSFYIDGTQEHLLDSWNTELGELHVSDANSKFEVRLAISQQPKSLVASNAGFLIAANPPQIIPYRFPPIIGGEINFVPGAVDLDISRSNIIESQKSKDIRRELSVYLKVFFRRVIAEVQPFIPFIINYLQYYLVNLQTNSAQYFESYIDFYTTRELIDLITPYLSFRFNNQTQPLTRILQNLKSENIGKIYMQTKDKLNDYELLQEAFLISRGNFVFKRQIIGVLFRDSTQSFSNFQVIQIIANEYGLEVIDISKISGDEITAMKLGIDVLPIQIAQQLSIIERENLIKIAVVNFSEQSKAFIRSGNEYFINMEHLVLRHLIDASHSLNAELIKSYLLGLLGLAIKS